MRQVTLVIVSALVWACSGRPAAGGGGEETPETISVAQYMAATRSLYCAYTTCALGFSEDAGCAVTEDFLGQIEKSLRSGRRRLEQDRARAFLDAVSTLDGHACWGEQVTGGLARMVEALTLAEAAAPGAVGLGGDCFDAPECEGGFCDLSTCPGLCVALVPPGGVCTSHTECGAEAVCLESADGTARCAALAPLRAACDDARPCVDPFACIEGVCADPAGVLPGAVCEADAGCGPDARCRDGRCVFKSGVGGPCSAGVTVFPSPSPDCRGSLVCAGVEFDEAGAVSREGRCAVPSEAGEPCYPDAVEFMDGVALNTSADGCFFGLVCDPASRRCARGPKAEEPCLAGRCEQASYCDGTLCHTVRAPGERCQSAVECFGACEGGVCGEPPANVACPAP